MSPRVLIPSTVSISFLSLLVSIPAHSVTQSVIAASAGVPVPKGSRAISVDLSGVSVAQRVRVVGPYELNRVVTVRGDFVLLVKQPGAYTVHFSDVKQGEWRFPSAYQRRVTVPKRPGVQKISIGYQPARLRFDGVGRLRTGMTFPQALAADPTVRAELDFGCLQASSRFADLFFNPAASGGRLAMIIAKPGIRTTAGVKVGSSYAAAKRAYRFRRTTLNSQKWDYIRVAPDYRARGGREATRTPLLGVEFESGPARGPREFRITGSTVSSLFVDAGQKCIR